MRLDSSNSGVSRLGKELGPDDDFDVDSFGGQGSPEHGVLAGTDGDKDSDTVPGHELSQTRNDEDVVFIPEEFRINGNAELPEIFRQRAGFLKTGDDRAVFTGTKEALNQGQQGVLRPSRPETVGDKHYSCLLRHHVLCRL